MRWGITDSMDATDVCLEEIKRCYENSYGPAFVACLSRRYGTKSLQTKIPLIEFEQIKKIIKNGLIEQFYEIDNNFIQNPFYILKLEAEFKLQVNFHPSN